MGNCLVHEFKKKPYSRAPAGPKPKSSVRSAEDGDRMREPAVRVKVVLTKKETARLLSTLAGGNGSALENMLCELERTRSSRSPNRGRDCWRPALESIPEDQRTAETDINRFA